VKAFITGGAGFAGSHLVDYLLNQGQQVAVLAPHRESLQNLAPAAAQIRIEEGDVRDAERLGQVLRELRPQRIYHLAALSSPSESLHQPEITYAVNFGGTLNLFEACRSINLDARVLLVSSPEVYGAPPADCQPIRESLPFQPLNPYAASKAAAEMLAMQYFESYCLPIVRVRPFNHTGPRQARSFVCSSLALQAAEIELGLRPHQVIAGNLHARRDFSDVRDIVRGYHSLIECGEPGEVYHLCSGRAVSIEEVARALAAMTSGGFAIESQESKSRSKDAPLLVGDASKARQAVGWTPEFSLESTLRDLKQYWLETLSSDASPRANAGAANFLPG
jgi:GDP-4-dehydro-6-deoxy-D-mannose reductase